MTKETPKPQFEYMNTSERRVLDLREVGLPWVPLLGYCNYRNTRPSVPEHHHPDSLEIHYCVRNTITFNFNERTWLLRPGDLLINMPNERHTVNEHPKGLILYWLILQLELPQRNFLDQPVQEATALKQALLNMQHRHFHGNERIKHLFQSLHILYDEAASNLRTLRLRAVLMDLLLEILGAARSHRVPVTETRLTHLLQAIQRNPEKSISIDELARQANMAPTHFIKRFRALAGLPPQQYQLACRMEQARKLLKESSLPVTEIAMRLGFCSSQHFANLFKRHTGITPSACRKT